MRMARSRMSRAESPTVVAINLLTSGHDGPTGRPSCCNRRGPSIPAAVLAVHHPRRCMFKEGTQSFGAGGRRHAAPSLFSVGSQKRIHIFDGNIAERTILLAKPAQELLYVPVLIPD